MIEKFESFQKTCNRCGLDKDISDFYKSGQSNRPECKTCTNKVNKKYKSDNRDFINQLKRKYHQSERGKEADKKYVKYYRQNMPPGVKDKLRNSHKAGAIINIIMIVDTN